ncbi:MAG: hypothetical protein ABW223_13100 [Rariglobus sp.]
MPDPLNRKPWPMKWVAVAILACIIPYTWITVKYRKPTPAYQPYEDSKQRANVIRLLEAGFNRITVDAERPADPQNLINSMSTLAEISDAPAGLAEGLDKTLVEVPQLPLSFSSVSAPRETAGLLPYPIVFTCTLGDQKHQLGGAQVFIRGETLVIVPQFEPLDGDLTARSKESPVAITLPGGTLKPGRHTLVICGSERSRQWTVEVK